jgi:site-specific recombinase XerD
VDTTFSTLTDHFLTYGMYLRGWSPRTVRTYRQGLTALDSVLDGAQPSTATLQSFVIAMRQRGLTSGGINMYARTINSFLSWLHAEGHTPERLRIRLLPNPHKPLQALSDTELRRLVMFRPRGRLALRTWTIVVTLLDTGLRFDEGIDTSTSGGRMTFGILGSIAEFERERLRERTLLGLQRARKQGKRLGRPVDQSLRKRIVQGVGLSVPEAAKRVGCSTATVQKVRKAA